MKTNDSTENDYYCKEKAGMKKTNVDIPKHDQRERR